MTASVVVLQRCLHFGTKGFGEKSWIPGVVAPNIQPDRFPLSVRISRNQKGKKLYNKEKEGDDVNNTHLCTASSRWLASGDLEFPAKRSVFAQVTDRLVSRSTTASKKPMLICHI